MYKAVIFDVDGTLLDSERIYMEAWRQAAAQHGFVMTERALLRTRAVNRQRAMEIFQEELGPDFSYLRIRPLRVQIEDELFRRAPDLVKPGARALLDWLRERQISMGVASTNLTADTTKHLEQFGLLQYFSVVVGGDQVQHGKPDPDIFLRAASLLHTEPADCLAIGDTDADVQSATAAGMPILLVPDQVQPTGRTRAQSAAVLDTLDEAIPLVKRLLEK